MGYENGAATVPADGIEVFGSDEFGTLRTVDEDGMTLFCAEGSGLQGGRALFISRPGPVSGWPGR